jgi:hypothetical protein
MATKASNIAQAARTIDASGNVDGDTLDSLDSSQFLRSDTSDTMTGNLTMSGNLTVTGETILKTTKFDSAGYSFYINTDGLERSSLIWQDSSYSNSWSVRYKTNDTLNFRKDTGTSGAWVQIDGQDIVTTNLQNSDSYWDSASSTENVHWLRNDTRGVWIGFNSAPAANDFSVGVDSSGNFGLFNETLSNYPLKIDTSSRIDFSSAYTTRYFGPSEFHENVQFDANGNQIIIDHDGVRDSLYIKKNGVTEFYWYHDNNGNLDWRTDSGGNEIQIDGNRIITTADSNRINASFIATQGQTTFNTAYTVGGVDVFLNGVKLATSDFTATNGTSIVLSEAAQADDVIEINSYGYVAVTGALTNTGTQTIAGSLAASDAISAGSTTLPSLTSLYVEGASGITEVAINSVDANPDMLFQQAGTNRAGILWDRTVNGLSIGVDSTGADVYGQRQIEIFDNEIKVVTDIKMATLQSRIHFSDSTNVTIGTTFANGESSNTSGVGFIDESNNRLMFGVSDSNGAVLWGPTESGLPRTRNLITFNHSDDNSYPTFTNRTPSGKIVLASGPSAGGGDVARITINGGDGIGPLNEVDIDLNKSNFKSGGHYIYKHHNCTQIGAAVGGYSTSTTADCGVTVNTSGEVNGCSQGTGAAYNWWNYKSYCEKAGMRLCTRQEMLDNAVKGTGCSHDSRSVWTSTLDPATGKYWVHPGDPGDGTPELRYPGDASAPTAATTLEYGVRCCGQNDWG